jgi:PAS domain S-box-containing protein
MLEALDNVPETFVLNVDDNEMNRYIRSRVLQGAGIQVKEANTGARALEIVAAERPALVLLDVNLPDMSGYEVCRRIKNARETASIPVLQISATSHEAEAQIAGLEGGAEGYLVEPLDPGVLVATAKAMLRVRSLHEEMAAEVERRRQVEEALRARNRRLKLLSDVVSDLLAHDRPPEQFVAEVFHRFSAELGLDVYFHFVVTEYSGRQKLKSWTGVSEEAAASVEWLDSGDLPEVLRAAGVKAHICSSLAAEGRLLGSLCFGSRSRESFAADDADLIQTLCNEVALAFERWRAVDVLAKSERKLRRLVDANIIGVITADRERIFEANAVFLDMMGYTRDDLEAGRLRWAEMTPPEHAEADWRAAEELLTHGTYGPFEQELYRKDGERVPILMGGALLNPKPEWLCFVLDLSEQKRAEAALREVQKFESLGFLAGGVAHNINNILVGIMGNVSLVLYSATMNQEDRELLGEAVDSTERAANLTRQLLAYAGKGRFAVQPIDVSSFIDNLTGLFRSSISKQIELRFHLAESLPRIETDGDQIRQIMSNLVINAAEAIGDQSGTIEIGTRVEEFAEDSPVPPVALGKLGEGQYVVLAVSDTGAGMDERTRTRMFDPFFTTKFTGRGLGLAAVAGIVRSHDGAIAVTTSRGQGTTFHVYLPAAVERVVAR